MSILTQWSVSIVMFYTLFTGYLFIDSVYLSFDYFTNYSYNTRNTIDAILQMNSLLLSNFFYYPVFTLISRNSFTLTMTSWGFEGSECYYPFIQIFDPGLMKLLMEGITSSWELLFNPGEAWHSQKNHLIFTWCLEYSRARFQHLKTHLVLGSHNACLALKLTKMMELHNIDTILFLLNNSFVLLTSINAWF